MGFLDDVQASISRGTEAVGRGTKSTQLKMRQNDLLKERQRLAMQLGAALYEKYKDEPAAHEGTEVLFNSIAAIDAQRADIQAQIDALTATAQASQAAAVVYTCPGCGTKVPATDLFCSGCGKPIAEIQSAALATPVAPVATGLVCASCGAPITEDDVFCMNCGARVETAVSETPVNTNPEPQDETADFGASLEPVASEESLDSDEATNSEESVESAETALVESVEAVSVEPVEPVESAEVNEPVGLVADVPSDIADDVQSAATTCPNCGAPTMPEDVFCGSCGYNLQGA